MNIFTIKQRGPDPEKDPTMVLEKRVERLSGFMADNLADHPNFVKAVEAKVQKVYKKMTDKFEKLNQKCSAEFLGEVDNMDEEDLRLVYLC